MGYTRYSEKHWRDFWGPLLSGLIIGQFTEYKEDYSLKKDLYSTLDALVKEYDFPICYDFPVGHVTENLQLINGAEVEFVSGKKGVELRIITSYWHIDNIVISEYFLQIYIEIAL